MLPHRQVAGCRQAHRFDQPLRHPLQQHRVQVLRPAAPATNRVNRNPGVVHLVDHQPWKPQAPVAVVQHQQVPQVARRMQVDLRPWKLPGPAVAPQPQLRVRPQQAELRQARC